MRPSLVMRPSSVMRASRATRSVRMIAFSNLRRQKTQSILIGLTIAIAVFLSSLSLMMLSSINKPYQKMFERQRGSHLCYMMDRNLRDVEGMVEWWRARPGTEACDTAPYAYVKDGFNRIGKRDGETEMINILLYLTEYDASKGMDSLEMVEGERKDAPGRGEVWLPNAFASSREISLGDALEIPVDGGIATFTVSGIVIDPQFSAAASMNPERAWVGPGELGFFFRAESLHWSALNVRLASPELEDEAMRDFDEYSGGAVDAVCYPYSLLIQAFNMYFAILSSALLLLSLLTLLIAVFSVYNTVSGSINADFRRVGILKSLGFRPLDVVSGYSLQYFVISLIASPLALIISTCVGAYLKKRLFSAVSVSDAGGDGIGLALACLGFCLAFIPAVAALVARKAGRINAVEAIRLGESSGSKPKKSAFCLRTIRRAPLTLALAIKQLHAKKRRSLANGMTVLLGAFIILFGIDLIGFLNTTATQAPFWGYDGGDVTVVRVGKRFSVEPERLWAELAQDERALKVTAWDGASIAVPATAKKPAVQLYGIVVDGDMDEAGYLTIAGRNPGNPSEIALATNSMKALRAKIGDAIGIVIAGQRLDFTIVGTYQTFNTMGTGFRLQAAGYARGDPSFKLNCACVHLRDGTKAKEYIDSIETKYGEALDANATVDTILPTLRTISRACILIILAFIIIILAAGFTVIYNNVAMEADESRRVFGIYKTLGMTPRQLRRVLCLKSMAVGLSAGILGCLAVLFAQEPLMLMLLSILGYRSIGMPFNVPAASCAAVGLCLFSGLSAWIPSRAVKKLDVRELIVE